MGRTNFRTDYEQVAKPVGNVWYRSPLWSDDHMLGLGKDYAYEYVAWCGRPLAAAAALVDDELGGLFISERVTAKCAECRRRQEEWDGRDEKYKT